MKQLLLKLICLSCVTGAYAEENVIDVPYDAVGKRFRLLGRLHEPFGKMVTIQGEVLPDSDKTPGPEFLVRRINGVATQEKIVVKLAYKPKVKAAESYELTGYELGGYSGVPGDAVYMGVIPPQSLGFAYLTEFVIVSKDEIRPIVFTPDDFLGREALFSGIAHNDGQIGQMRGDGWSIRIGLWNPFPADVVGKTIETFGRYGPRDSTHTRYALLGHYEWRLVKLEDQIDKYVVLRGVAYTANNEGTKYYFRYRGSDLYVEGLDEPGAKKVQHRQTIEVRGVLRKKQLPRIDHFRDRQPDTESRDEFVVEAAIWEPIDKLLLPED
jgi:hypothetical protein